MGKIKRLAYEPGRCLVCCAILEHASTGRPRRFCGDACRQRDFREFRKWAKATVAAELAGGPELPMTWRHY